MNTFIRLLLLLEIFFIIKSDDCQYYNTSGNLVTVNSNDRETCFLYSYSDEQNSVCCYDKSNKKCVKKSTDAAPEENIECPEKTKINNNCGLAGMFQPVNSSQCTGMSLVEAFCCYVEINGDGANNACFRSKKYVDLGKHKKNRGEVDKTLASYGDGYTIKNITCYGEWIAVNILLYSFINFILF